ncbi:MAG: MogA/MoaB family molybdenum cofactor biosynthesis protein [Solirubrobacterales bacterium]|nr:MogA/MoaB family molybdenum cofactor biosynthesis protein [Solirubrobacterales bacterium]
MRAAIITVSSSRTNADDRGGPALAEFAAGLGAELAGRELVHDDANEIADRLVHWADQSVELILTTGGTGLSPEDITPEATVAVLERQAPGIAEAMRAASAQHTGHWMLSRGVAGIRANSLIINFPGNPKAIEEAGAAIAPALPHAVALITGESGPARSHESGSSTSASH